MKTIVDSVKTILETDSVAREGLRLGYLNLSAYAEKILPQVEDLTWKSVQKQTVVVALARLSKDAATWSPLHPSFTLDDLTIKSPLSDITYDKTERNLKDLKKLQQELVAHPNHFVMVTQGSREVTIIVPSESKQVVLDTFSQPPKQVFDHLVAVTVSFSEQYLEVPNILFTILSAVANYHINVREVVSTYTELSLLVAQKDLDQTLKALQGFFSK